MRRYRGFIVDSERWDRFRFRPDDIVISTPAKCGTTWMQTIIGMLVLDRIDLGAPISTISPWLDMLTYTDEETFRLLEEQRHRRFIKTHTPLDGVPRLTSVTYITMVRHPLDVALSYRDHDENLDSERFVELRTAAAGPDDTENGSFRDALNVRKSERHPDDEPEAPDAYLRWWIDNDVEPRGNGPYGLADYCNQIMTYWDARADPNVHQFHYTDLWNDRDGEMRRVAAGLGVTVDEERWPAFVEAAGLDSMRSRAGQTVPENNVGLWRSPEQFFPCGGDAGLDVAPRLPRHHPLPRAAERLGWRSEGLGAARTGRARGRFISHRMTCGGPIHRRAGCCCPKVVPSPVRNGVR